MKIAEIKLNGFKRFNDVIVKDIPESSRLVVVTGANGSGKSGLLDALNYARRQTIWGIGDPAYFNKIGGIDDAPAQALVEVIFHGNPPPNIKSALWVRPAYRHEAEFTAPGIERKVSVIDDPGADRMISAQELVKDNYVRLASSSLDDLYKPENRQVTAGVITDAIVGPLRQALEYVFDDLKLNSLTDPLADGTFFFDKGSSKHFPFKNLSAGERAAFDLLLDLSVRTRTFKDTVFAIDEPELHLGNKVQGRLLDQLLKLLPDGCQLWIATHSPGLMKRALELYKADPDAVCFIDTFGHDFDQAEVVTPIRPTREFWRRTLEVALDDIAGLVAPSQVILCEGHEVDGGRDATCYRAIFNPIKPDVEFLSVGSSNEVQSDKQGVAAAIQVLAPGTQVLRLIDLDDHNQSEVEKLNDNGVRVLSRRNIESFLFADEVIEALYAKHGNAAAAPSAISEKAKLLAESIKKGNPSDDLKKITKSYRAWIQKDLGLTQVGSTTTEFARSELAPLITPGTTTYDDLGADIFGK